MSPTTAVVAELEALGETAKRERFHTLPISEILSMPLRTNWLLKPYLPADSLVELFGPPESGKSFLAVDWALHIATGTAWNDNPVKQGAVLYIVGEGLAGFSKRVQAWQKHHEIQVSSEFLRVSAMPADLGSAMGATEVMACLEQDFEMRPSLVVVDTLSRSFGGRDENSSGDMATVIRLIDAYIRSSGATALLVHHPGHGNTDRPRGSSALRGALDADYSLKKDDATGIRKLECQKVKDHRPPEEMALELCEISLDILEEDGSAVTSCVICPIDGNEASKRIRESTPQAPKGKNQTRILEFFDKLEREQKSRLRTRSDTSNPLILASDVRARFLDDGGNSSRFSEAINGLVERGQLRRDGPHLIKSNKA